MSPVRTAAPKAGSSSHFNLFVLRRLYNRGNLGRGMAGETRRYQFHPTITFNTMNAMTKAVPTGRGQYSSPVVELGIRVVLCLIGMLSVQTVAEELAVAMLDRSEVANRLGELSRSVAQYRAGEEPVE